MSHLFPKNIGKHLLHKFLNLSDWRIDHTHLIVAFAVDYYGNCIFGTHSESGFATVLAEHVKLAYPTCVFQYSDVSQSWIRGSATINFSGYQYHFH